MDIQTLLQRIGQASLTPEEESELTKELASAYHQDELASASREIQRIAEKVKARLQCPDESQQDPGHD